MPLEAGDKLGPYEILGLIGKGGMGEVYRARDSKLDRDVAIKVLPPAFASDADRLVRFEREARVLAQLNHPGIAAIYGVEDRALVMELVPGPTLADRIKQGAIPAAEAEEFLLQIAEALEYAHERGIVHRDLKPANIKIDPDDKVKILDFGLAKAFADPIAGMSTTGDPAESPTITIGGTIAGTILGTAAYMAPEQARGKKVDKRADIWAFGAIVWEMLAGERLFQGEDTVQVLSRVLEQPVDLERTPARFWKLLARCLDRNPKQRLRDIGEARFLLEEPAEARLRAGSQATQEQQKSWLSWVAEGVLVVALGVLAAMYFREQAPEAPKTVRFSYTPENVTIASSMRFALSPDGTKLAYIAARSDGVHHLWIRALDTLESRSLPAAEVQPNVPIFWSFDNRFVVFASAGKLKKVDVTGGPAQTLCDVTGIPVGGSWNQDGVILYGSSVGGPLMRVSSEGGMAVPATTLDLTHEERNHFGPVFLPDGRHFLHFRQGEPESTGIYLGSLDDKPGHQPSKRLLAADYTVEFAPSPDGRAGQILFLREGTLFAQPFDLRRLELTGEPVPIVERVANFRAVGQFSASKTGALVYRTGGSEEGLQLTWFDRQGKILGAPSEPSYSNSTVSLSPNGSRVAAVRANGTANNLWLVDFARAGPHEAKTRLTYSQNDQLAAWSPDGAQVAFSSSRSGRVDVYRHAANGAGEDELLLKSDHDKRVDDWSRDGRFLLYEELAPKTVSDLWVLPMTESAGERKPIPFLETQFNEVEGRFSPDGRWIAYRSNESGGYEIYVRPFPPLAGGGGKWMVSQSGGYQPRWRRDGRELFYQSTDGQMMAAEVSASGAAFRPGVPKPLFKTGAALTSSWDVSADGTRFLIPVPAASETSQAPFTVVLNWMAGLKR